MERDNKRKKKQRNCEDQSCNKRSPLQNLNGLQVHKIRSKNTSKTSSAVPIEAPKCCLKFPFSSNSCAASSSSSRTQFDKKLKGFSKLRTDVPKKTTAGAPKVLFRSKENEIPTKPFSKKSEIWESGKTIANPFSKIGQRSKLSSVQRYPISKLKKGARVMGKKVKNSEESDSGKSKNESGNSNLNCVENCTPVGKVACGSGVDLANFDDSTIVREDSVLKTGDRDTDANAVNTPPVEASVSPEIQCGSHSKMLASKSGATPICYGAGHLLSGVKDKRKCRRRGSLKGIPVKASLFSDDGNLISGLQDSSVPLLAGASVRWHLSPCNEEHEDHGSDEENRLKQCSMTGGNDSVILDLWSSPSSLSTNIMELLYDSSSYNGSGSVGEEAKKRKARMNILCPQNDSEFHGFYEHSNEKVDEHVLDTTPNSSSHRINVSLGEGSNVSFQIGSYSALSVESLSSGNIIQTPHSDSSLETCAEIDQRSLLPSELNLITETVEKVALSQRTGMSKWESPDFGSHIADTDSPSKSIDLTQHQKNVDSFSSWDFDFTLENLVLSQMRISWREVLVSGIVETDELDYCRCLSDEEIDTAECSGAQLMPFSQIKQESDWGGTQSGLRSYLGSESGANPENHLVIDNDICPAVLDYEPIISAKNRNKMSPSISISDTRAESICTNGGGLVASGESDWTDSFSNTCFNSNNNWNADDYSKNLNPGFCKFTQYGL